MAERNKAVLVLIGSFPEVEVGGLPAVGDSKRIGGKNEHNKLYTVTFSETLWIVELVVGISQCVNGSRWLVRE